MEGQMIHIIHKKGSGSLFTEVHKEDFWDKWAVGSTELL